MGLRVLDTVADFRAACDGARRSGKVLGLVPTMGALHAGHLALVAEARRRADEVAVSIFVNPTQFGPKEDFSKYPRTLEADLEKCGAAGVGIVFAPSVEEMYPPGDATRVTVRGLTDELCGRSRPGHFEGVTTVVAKLFAAAGPCRAIFGRKDYQQLKVIERMARDLLLPVEVIGHPTVREADGLALSSRNAYLSADDRARALAISRALSDAVRSFEAGQKNAGATRKRVEQMLLEAGLRVDYARVADPERLELLDDAAEMGPRALVAVAAYAGKARLIDNVVLGEDPAPVGGSA